VSQAAGKLGAMRLFRRQDGRTYAIADPQPDLLGDSVIVTIHGSVHSRRGGVHTYLSALISIEELVRIRCRHGYLEVPGGAEGVKP